MASNIEKAMRIIWEGEGKKWDDMSEYPISVHEQEAILARLRKTVKELQKKFPNGI